MENLKEGYVVAYTTFNNMVKDIKYLKEDIVYKITNDLSCDENKPCLNGYYTFDGKNIVPLYSLEKIKNKYKMEKTKINQIVVLTDKIGKYCKAVHSDTICKVIEKLDENHVKLQINVGSYPELRNANINKFRLPIDEAEEKKLTKLFKKSKSYSYATI